MGEEQHEMIHSHTSERPALAMRTARCAPQETANRVGSKTDRKTPETTHAVQHLVFSEDGARVRCSRCTRVGGLFGWPSVSKYVRIRIFGK